MCAETRTVLHTQYRNCDGRSLLNFHSCSGKNVILCAFSTMQSSKYSIDTGTSHVRSLVSSVFKSSSISSLTFFCRARQKFVAEFHVSNPGKKITKAIKKWRWQSVISSHLNLCTIGLLVEKTTILFVRYENSRSTITPNNDTVSWLLNIWSKW